MSIKIITNDGPKETHQLCGWSGSKRPELLRKAFNMFGDEVAQPLKIYGARSTVGARSMLWEVGRKVLGGDTENYPQLRGDCLLPGSKILMANGEEKDIEKILIGDTVLNHHNEPAKVIDIISKSYTGDMITIKPKGYHRSLTATATHDSLTLPYHQYRFKFNGFGKSKFGNYQEKDFILLPFGLQTNKDIALDLKKYLPKANRFPYSYDKEFVYYRKQKLKRFIKVDNRFARFIGLYLAEGGTHSYQGQVYFCFNANELLLMKDIEVFAKEIFGVEKVSLQKTGNINCTRVCIQSKILKDFIKAIIPENIYTKNIPDFFFRVSESIKMDLIKGWLDGDGYKKLKSDNLGIDMTRLALSCGINVKSWRRLRKIRAKVHNTQVALYGSDAYKIYDTEEKRFNVKSIICNNTPYGFARQIKTIEREYVENKAVYCITTDGDHTIIANGIATCNCVSFGAKNASEYLQFFPIANGTRYVFTNIFPPYLWGCGRVFVGNNELGTEDGSMGVWQAKAVMQYGVVASNTPGVPPYSNEAAYKWGNYPGPDPSFITIGKEHLVKSAALVQTWQDVMTALTNGYPVTIASDVGFDMEQQRDGFMHYTTHWSHQMCIIGADDGDGQNVEPHAAILNSWGDVFGQIKDFRTGENWPVGTLRVRKADIETILAAGDSFAYSSMEGFPAQDLPRDLFDIF
jgi:hypothetical protein